MARSEYLDSVGGILLTHMIIGHCCQWSGFYDVYERYTNFLAFFMPWFFFKGGMFFKVKPFKVIINSSISRLIKPFIFYSIVGSAIWWMQQGYPTAFEIVKKNCASLYMTLAVPGNLALWFLPSLFCVRILANYTCKTYLLSNTSIIIKILRYSLIIIFAFSFAILHWIKQTFDISYPYYLSNISSGFVFFMMGFLLKKHKLTPLQFSLLVLVYISFLIVYPTYVDMRSGSLEFGKFILWIPSSIIGILIINHICLFLLNNRNFFSIIGRDTMPYYCLHWCIILIVSIFFKQYHNHNIEYLATLIGTNIIGLPFIITILRNFKIPEYTAINNN